MRFSGKKQKGPIRGQYKDFNYESSLELAFILHYESLGHEIKNYDLEPIEYSYEGKQRKYYPDFIVNNEIIVEVKGFFFGKKNEIAKKKRALTFWCKDKNYNSAFITRDSIPKRYVKKAMEYHREIR